MLYVFGGSSSVFLCCLLFGFGVFLIYVLKTQNKPGKKGIKALRMARNILKPPQAKKEEV